MAEKIYETEGVVASFPYTFKILAEGNEKIGVATAFIYENVEFPTEEERNKVIEALKKIPTQANSEYTLRDDKVIYETSSDVAQYPDIYAANVGVRRHFIEDYLETDLDVEEIVKPYHAKTMKTEFVI